MKTIIIEDDLFVASHLCTILELRGFTISAILNNMDDFYNSIYTSKPDFVFLDINLGTKETITAGLDIAKICKELNIIIFFITACSNENIIKKALEYDPENYILKPFTEETLNIPLLLLKNKFLSMRPNHQIELCTQYFYNPFEKNIYFKEKKLRMTTTELKLLDILYLHKNSIVSHEHIHNLLWGTKFVSDSALRELISRVRKKIPCIEIINQSGIGYELVIK